MNSFILTFILSSVVHATTSIVSISGVSNSVKSTSTDNTTTSWIAYGGISGTTSTAWSTCGGGTGPCNTCIGPDATLNNNLGDAPCNPVGVFPNTVITIVGSTTVAKTGANKWVLCDGNSEYVPSTSALNLNTNFTTTWAELCTKASGTNTTCAAALSTTQLYFGAGTDCNAIGSEKVAIKFISHFVDPNGGQSNYTDCPAGAVTGAYGACHFKLFPGDEKVYLESSDFYVESTWPTVSATAPSTITFDNIFFFFTEQINGETDQQTMDRVTNDIEGEGSSSSVLAVSGEELAGSFIDRLSNNSRYCFRMASQDLSKHIQYFSPTGLATTTPDDVCMTPSEVVGILTDKKCFIATAAYGSEMEEHVKLLRKFRNEYMAPFWIGRKLIKTYYKLSPPIAKWISDKENVKPLVRGLLWPIMGWAELSLKFGWSVVIAPFVFLGLALFYLRRRKRFESI